MHKLTDAALRAALKKPPTLRRELTDGAVPGLSLRLGPGGATWSLKLRVTGEGGVSDRGHQIKGKSHRVTLGKYPAVSIEAARSVANTYLDQAKHGVSPIVALESAATAGGFTIKTLAEKFRTDYVRMRELRAVAKYETALRVHILPELGDVLADVLTREQVRVLIKKTMVRIPRNSGPRDRPRGGKEAARSALVVLRKMISWGMQEGLLRRRDNPVSSMEANLPRKRQRARVLSLEEARIAWRAAEDLRYPFGPAYQLLLLTGCRPGEWSAAQRSWIDLSQALIVIPADHYKSQHVHIVPLVHQAVRILKRVLTEYPVREYVLSGGEGRRPLAGWVKAHARLMRSICALTGERVTVPWTPHDLRRTVATRIAEQLGVGGEQLIRRVLGHSDGSVTAIYNRYGYIKEMRAALERWALDLTETGPKRSARRGATTESLRF